MIRVMCFATVVVIASMTLAAQEKTFTNQTDTLNQSASTDASKPLEAETDNEHRLLPILENTPGATAAWLADELKQRGPAVKRRPLLDYGISGPDGWAERAREKYIVEWDRQETGSVINSINHALAALEEGSTEVARQILEYARDEFSEYADYREQHRVARAEYNQQARKNYRLVLRTVSDTEQDEDAGPNAQPAADTQSRGRWLNALLGTCLVASVITIGCLARVRFKETNHVST